VIIRVKVIPNASRPLVERREGYYLVRVDAPPKKGKANQRLIAILAGYFKIPKTKLRIVKGLRGRIKEVMIID